MASVKPANIDEYLGGFPDTTREVLEKVRAEIKKTVPDAEETISYAIPAFTLNGKNLIYFAGYKNHISVYPAPRENEAFKKELAVYKGGPGTVQFPLDKPIPFPLVVKIVKFRMMEILEKDKRK